MIYLLFLSLSLPLIHGDQYTYNVKVDMAENLPDEDPDAPEIFGWRAWTNKNDPYVQIYAYGSGNDDALVVKETSIIEGTEKPQWNEMFEFNDGDTVGPYTKFLFKVWDDDSTFDKDGSFSWGNLNDPDYLGQTNEILVSEINNCNNDFDFRLPVYRDDKECGLLVVEITKDGCNSAAAYETGNEDGKNKDCLVGDIMYQNGDNIGIIGETCDEYSDVAYIGTQSYCKNGKVTERKYYGDCEKEYSGSKCCQEKEPGTFGGAVCITRECVEWGIGGNNECFNAGGYPFCLRYTPDGCNTCTCQNACTLMACENGGQYGNKQACIECEVGYDLIDDGQKCECGKQVGDDCELDVECCDHYCVETGGRKQCYLDV